MIEGQEGVTWPQWLALAQMCERAGLEGLFRSDHYMPLDGGDDHGEGSLDAWTTLAGLAARTERIRLGTMVSPATFRHPSVLGSGGDDGRPHLRRPGRAGARGGLARARARGLRLPVRAARRAHGRVRGAGRRDRRPVDDRAVLLRRPPLPARRGRGAAAAGAAAAPSAHHRRLGPAALGRGRRPAGAGVQRRCRDGRRVPGPAARAWTTRASATGAIPRPWCCR